ncbi:uncharacterized protein BX664DRAFT_298137 [Halteromyces radiatus]|uniref:uncharacterized protein n=1 Tax=Halteromyces radiatus TaxID=101107 RepID=UPI002220ABE5|nr:uncharacterized protein BX664DRAFT_298137 [Halteromyces radiatus]KAI8090006.1 hypothetical protein BX664DRAFT_298137 [Halteromyces radiatus]
MREPNFSSPAQNKAAIVISSTLYDRRALDCTATLPLVNSLTHLAYMTSTSPRIREILASDGGLERLVKILATSHNTDKHSLWKWSLAFQCVVNIGVRGTEAIRTRVVEVGAVHVVLAILENFLRAMEQAKLEKEQERNENPVSITTTTTTTPTMSLTFPTNSPSLPILSSSISSGSTIPFAIPKRRTFLSHTVKTKSRNKNANLSSIPLLNSLASDVVLHREDDILLSLQLLAYLSKYPHIRHTFHNNHRHNVFSVVEKFTHRLLPQTIAYWAGVIMRNACRKDESQGGIRQCASMDCGKWERYPREFAKCRRCRKAKYCSKTCQSKAWGDGHRWWCVERTHSSHPTNTISTTTAAAAAAVVAAAPPPPTNPLTDTEQIGSLDEAATTTTHIPINIDETRPIDQQQQATTQRQDFDIDIRTHTHGDGMSDRLVTQQPLLFYHRRRRHSRSAQSLASGSSTEVEVDTSESLQSTQQDLMEID